MAIVEQARQQVINYEQDTAAAQTALTTFEAENGARLEAIRSEFEDYKQHPLWQEYRQRQDATDQPASAYYDWSRHDKKGHALGWPRQVLYCGTPALSSDSVPGHGLMNLARPDTSILPLSLGEFDRRATIVSHIGQVAAMLRGHRGEPVVSVAGYHAPLYFKTTDGTELKGNASQHSRSEYWYGKVHNLPKTRVVVGAIDQPDEEPVFTTSQPDEETTRGTRRLVLANSVSGIVSAYSLPDDNRQLKRATSKPHYQKKGMFESSMPKRKTLPFGNSVMGDFPLGQLRGRDLLVIDGPHQIAADHELSGDIVLHRPKQKIEADPQSRDQEVAIAPGEDDELYEATVVSEEREVSLPTLRHNTIWLIGQKAVRANLIDAIWDLTHSASQNRGTHRAILSAANDLIESMSDG